MVMSNMQTVGGSSLGFADAQSFKGRNLLDSDRYKNLDRKAAYANACQHDHKRYSWDGRIIQSGRTGMGATQPLLGEKQGGYVPLSMRRPSTPYRLAKVMVAAFTNLLFGDKRFPELKCPGDAGSQDYVQALSRVGSLPSKIIQARNQGGASGTACLSWAFVNGKPRYASHQAKNIFVHEWEDRENHIPRWVSECFTHSVEEWDPIKNKLVKNEYWWRRDWTPLADVIFKPVLVQSQKLPRWEPDMNRSYIHKDRLCHFTWIQNLPTEDIDGESDYEGLFEDFDELDIILSVICRGAKLNLDPTLVLKIDRAKLAALGVSKGSDQSLIVDPGGGDAKYLELQGTSITAGLALANDLRTKILEVGQCVIPDPDKVAAGSVASVSLKVVYATMTGKVDILREQYGPGIRRLLEGPLTVARKASRSTVIITDEEGNETEIQPEILLPPKVTKIRKPASSDDDEANLGTKVTELEPGEAEEVETEWGEYFKPTADEIQKSVTTLTGAAGGPGTAIMSTETACELAMRAYGRDPDDEVAKLQKQVQGAQDAQNQMFTGMHQQASDLAGAAAAGGSSVQTTHTLPLPGGGQVQHKTLPASSSSSSSESVEESTDDGPPGTLSITPADASSIVTVNEARVSMGMPPLNDPDGHLTLASYKAKYAKPIATAANANLGKLGATSGSPPPPPAGMAPHPGAPPGAGGPPGGAPKPPAAPPTPPAAAPRPGGPPGAPPGAPGAPPRPAAPPPMPPRPPMPGTMPPKPPKPGGGNPFG